ncbi:hypothetical protein M422DRAFT_243065 [Sphaerobolus stellatus SS14]|nr:hypothetical protein M422DRAFT_243065 [Sphaerobolus stellatus SS14]
MFNAFQCYLYHALCCKEKPGCLRATGKLDDVLGRRKCQASAKYVCRQLCFREWTDELKTVAPAAMLKPNSVSSTTVKKVIEQLLKLLRTHPQTYQSNYHPSAFCPASGRVRPLISADRQIALVRGGGIVKMNSLVSRRPWP